VMPRSSSVAPVGSSSLLNGQVRCPRFERNLVTTFASGQLTSACSMQKEALVLTFSSAVTAVNSGATALPIVPGGPPPNLSLKLTGRPAALPRPELRPGRPAA
jgi:hypothetical protein